MYVNEEEKKKVENWVPKLHNKSLKSPAKKSNKWSSPWGQESSLPYQRDSLFEQDIEINSGEDTCYIGQTGQPNDHFHLKK